MRHRSSPHGGLDVCCLAVGRGGPGGTTAASCKSQRWRADATRRTGAPRSVPSSALLYVYTARHRHFLVCAATVLHQRRTMRVVVLAQRPSAWTWGQQLCRRHWRTTVCLLARCSRQYGLLQSSRNVRSSLYCCCLNTVSKPVNTRHVPGSSGGDQPWM